MLRKLGILIPIFILMLLGGCTIPVVDDALSKINNGGDCSVARLLRGQAACRPPVETVASEDKKKVFCYRTMGVVDCYEKKDPFAMLEGRRVDDKLLVGTPSVAPSKPVTRYFVTLPQSTSSKLAEPMDGKPATRSVPFLKSAIKTNLAPATIEPPPLRLNPKPSIDEEAPATIVPPTLTFSRKI